MFITGLTLENIKSYVREDISFSEGLNAISGHNGSGKTTILEAIGFALFDFLPYSQADFVREGQKSGTIRVRIVISDGREYEVVRKVGSGSAYHVTDVETGMRIVDRGPQVLDWIRSNALGIDGETNLESLFKNAVGVPQGLMTADFQQAPTGRKHVFDPLLRVEEYRKAYDNLRETNSYLTAAIATAREQIARLETQTADIPPLREKIASLLADLATSETRLGQLATDLEDAEAGKQVLDAIEQDLVAQRQAVAAKSAEVVRYEALLEEQEKAVESARVARREADAAEPGYRAVIEARERLTGLEERRRERERLETQLSAVAARLKEIEERIRRLEGEAADARARALEAAGLGDAVREQDEVEAKVHDTALRLEVEVPMTQRADALRSGIRGAELQVKRVEGEIEAARQAQQEAGRLEGIQRELREVAVELTAIGARQDRLKDVEREGRVLRERHDVLVEQSRRLQAARERGATLADAASRLDDLVARQQSLREERAAVKAAIEYQDVARAALERRQCPLLELQCPVVTAEPVVLAGFTERAESLSERLPALEVELVTVQASLTGTREAADELRTLQLEAAKLAGSEEQLAEVGERLAACRAEYTELKKGADAASALQIRHEELMADEARLKAAADRAGRLEPLESQLARERERLQADQAELDAIVQQLAALETVRVEAKELGARLTALDNPRRRQQDLLAAAGRLPGIERQIATDQTELQAESDRLRAMVGQKQRFVTLDGEIEAQQRIIAERSDDHERHLQYREEGAALEARERSAAQTRTLRQRAQEAERAARETLTRTEARYDAGQHATLKTRCTELGREIASENMKHELYQRDLDREQEQLAYLQRQEVKLQEARAGRESLEQTQGTLGLVRDTIKAAGPAITESLLHSISQIANDFFAEIMDDHAAELRWDRDYEVLVQRGAETRKFAQLSGGEQMSAALAVRLALLKEMSEVDVAFFDEPTQNMDEERRFNLAGQIRQVRGFKQLIVISHDNTFEHDTDTLIRLQKVNGETRATI